MAFKLRIFPRRPLAMVRLILLLAVIPTAGLIIWLTMLRMPGSSYAGGFLPLSADEQIIRDQLVRHVYVLAQDIGPRHDRLPNSLERAAQYIEQTLTAVGYHVESQRYGTPSAAVVRNIIVERRGRTVPEQIVIIGAHYDTVEGSPGANDNGTGVAALLELARIFTAEPTDRTIRFIGFVNEEPPHFETPSMGSRVYARRAAERGEDIRAMISLETIGYYSSEQASQHYPYPFGLFYPDRGDFIAFVSNVGSRRLLRRCIATFRRTTAFPSQGGAVPAVVTGIGWSDHASFWRHGYAAIMVTDTAAFRYPYYHSAADTPEKLDYDRTARVVGGLAHVLRDLATTQSPEP